MSKNSKKKSTAKMYSGVNLEGPLVLRCTLGLSPVTISEMKFRRLIHHNDKPLVVRQKDHDLIFVTKNNNIRGSSNLHTAEEVHYCLLFGHLKISDSQIKRLSKILLTQKKTFRTVVTTDGEHFSGQDFRGWFNKKLQENRVPLRKEAEIILRVFCVDEDYYVVIPAYTQSSLTFRSKRVEDRTINLPQTIAAALAFLSNPNNSDIVLDPFCGTGILLAEMNAFTPQANLLGFDLDKNTIILARKNLKNLSNLELIHGDGTSTNQPNGSITLFLSNLPSGKQHEENSANPDLYRNAINEMIRLGVPSKWRAVLLTSDVTSLEKSISENKNLKCSKRIKIKVRGEWAEIFLIHPIDYKF